MCNKTQTTTGKSTLPAYLESEYKGLLNAGQKAAARPNVTYNQPTVAGFTPMQNQAFQQTQQDAGNWAPYTNNASSMLTNAYNMFQAPNYGQTVSQYQNPYTQQVVDTTMANINRNNAIQQNQLLGQGVGQGVSPNLGDRMGLASAELGRNQALAGDQTMAQLESAGYTNAQQAAQAAGQTAQQAAGSMANLGNQVQTAAGTDIGRLLQEGGQQQQVGQQQLTNAYNQFQQQQQYPQQQIDWLASLAYGQPRGGSTSTTSPGPSLLSQLAGAGTAAYGLGNSGLFGSSGFGASGSGISGNKRGGPVHMDSGGSTTITAPQLSLSQYTEPVTGNYDAVNGLKPIAPPKEYWSDPKDPWISWTGAKGEPYSANSQRMWGENPLSSIGQLPTWPLDPHTLEANADPKAKFWQYARGGMPHMDDGGTPPPDFSGRSMDDFASETADSPPFSPYGGGAGGPPPPAMSPPLSPQGPGDGDGSMGAGPPAPYGGFFTSKGFPFLSMGLGMMGDTSPWPLTAIGKGAGEGLKLPAQLAEKQMDLDAHPTIDTSSGTIRVYYPSDKTWHDTGVPTVEGQKWGIEKPLLEKVYGQATADTFSPGKSGGPTSPLVLKTMGYPPEVISAVQATGKGPNDPATQEYMRVQGIGSNAFPGGFTPERSFELNQEATQGAQAATNMLSTNQAIQALLPYAKQGFGAETMGDVQKIFSTLGIAGVTQATAQDTLNSLIKKEFSESRELGGGIGNAIQVRNQREFGYLTTANVNLDNMPGANQIILQGLNNQANLVKTISQKQIQYSSMKPGEAMDGVTKTGAVGSLDPGWQQIQLKTIDANPIMDDKTIIHSMVSSAGQKSSTGQPLGLPPAGAPGSKIPVPKVPTTQEIQQAKQSLRAKVDMHDPIAVAKAEIAFNSVYGAGAAQHYLGLP